jgi:putative holliday junction resolvase
MAGRIIGLDVGQKRTGIAIASRAARLAQPHATVKTDEALDKIVQLAAEEDAEAIVVGLPRNLEGDETDQTRWVRQWVKTAKPKLQTPMYWQDEALTTSEATNRQLKSTGIDAEAASIILQDWLDSDEATRVNC